METDSEGHLHGGKQSAINERGAQEHERADNNELNKPDARVTIGGMENV